MNFVSQSRETFGNFEKRAEIPVTTSCRPPPITCNSGQHFVGNSDMFLFDVIVFATLPAHGIWWKTVLMSDVV